MADTTFVTGTVIEADWLNDVNAVVYTPGSTTAADIANVPAGNIVATDVQAALNELDNEKQPLDTDLTAIAALTTTAYGRSLLTQASASAARTTLEVVAATETTAGLVEKATSAEMTDGTANKYPDAALVKADTETRIAAAVAAAPPYTTVGPFSLGASPTTLSGIPAGVERVVVSFIDMSITVNGTDITFKLGGAVILTSGYTGRAEHIAVGGTDAGAALPLLGSNTSASYTHSGVITMELMDASTDVWVLTWVVHESSGVVHVGVGTANLPDDLAQIQFIASTGSFDGGTATIKYS